ncbi:MAG TPA: ABC transporter permease [Candidatus Onthocola gallistercoris]|uniref:ABC transporter permease n=1 Tax=Candidatus Onthocola gallistercoris TaxID=2840876 RepID=A0A9D1HFR9_9FIRM|nr:ABC transporter permease [Candidatus Onthocola gallistercoris]
MRAIFVRDFKSFFHSMMGYVFAAFFLVVVGFYMTAYNLIYATSQFEYTLNATTFIFFILIPVLTMRAFAEERKAKTDQMLLTAPVTVTQVVLGKFLALVVAFMIPMVVVAFYPLLLTQFGDVSLKVAYGCFLAYILMGIAFLALGMFISSLTESPIAAAFISFGVMLVMFLMPSIASLIPDGTIGDVLRSILSWFEITNGFDSFASGIFDVTAIVYYLSWIVLFNVLTVQSIQKRRWC